MADHIHKYRREKLNVKKNKETTWVMRCSLPRCNSYSFMQSKLSCPTLIGKEALCNRCQEEFLLDRRALKMSKPCCINCIKGAEDKKIKSIDKLFKLLEGEIRE